jgi:hypothetical protein
MIKEIVKMPPVFDGVNHISLSVHLFEVSGETFIKMYFLKECVKKPAQKKAGFMIQNKRVMRVISIHAHIHQSSPGAGSFHAFADDMHIEASCGKASAISRVGGVVLMRILQEIYITKKAQN